MGVSGRPLAPIRHFTARGAPMNAHHDDHDEHEHDLGLQHDLGTLERRSLSRRMARRGVLGVLGGLSVVAVAGCADDSTPTPTPASSSTAPSGGPGGTPGGGMGGDA